MEGDFIKWHNLQSLKIVKESDLKSLSNCIIEINLILNDIN